LARISPRLFPWGRTFGSLRRSVLIMPRYNPAEIEPKWQKFWEENRTFAAPRLPGERKLYVLDMFPYPSGDGLHVGHPEGYTATDIVSRYGRMQGKSVIHPMGFDAFGLPAEEHAIRTGTPPRESTERNIATFRRQLKMLGFSYDWDRELATTDVKYFRWTQWIFLQLYDTWYDREQEKGRPIAELPIPEDVAALGAAAVFEYQDDHRLAYQSYAPVNWCQKLGTVLANEEVIDGKSEVGGHPVTRLPLQQWMLRITAYGDRLEKDLEGLDWSDGVKSLQRNWIGRSEGAEVDFYLPSCKAATSGRAGETTDFDSWCAARTKTGFPRKPGDDVLRIYTTRPDTLFGATYMVIAPEHPFALRLTTPEYQDAVEQYCQQAAGKSDMDRVELAKEKTGVFTGSYATNPVNGEQVPIWIADYVMMGYGTGAIMAVPGHDVRDFDFAKVKEIPIVCVVDPGEQALVQFMSPGEEPLSKAEKREAVMRGETSYPGQGTAINSGPYDGLSTDEFKTKITADLTSQGQGRAAVNYKLRDWMFSRQRFWGEPFPILHELDDEGNATGVVRALNASDLPLNLPELEDFKPHGRPEPPLDKAPDEWLYVEIDGVRYKRETNTMPQWAGSCWYYLRFLDCDNDRALIDPEIEKAWMPIDLYIGGMEHAVLHLLYSRFWHKVLYDRGVVSTSEPFQKLVNQGMILGEVEMTGYRGADGAWVSAAEIKVNAEKKPAIKATGEVVEVVTVPAEEAEKQGDHFVLTAEPKIRLDSRAHKMSKSRGNVVNPDVVVREYGADSLRLYEMFMGPLEATKPWSMDGVSGVRGFLDRAWRMIVDEPAETLQLNAAVCDRPPTEEQNRTLHKTIKAVTEDLDRMAFNTAISRMMEFTNFFLKQKIRPRIAMEQLVLLLSPWAPHVAEELWRLLGHPDTLAYEPWPSYDEALIKEDTIEIVAQIRGKVRSKLRVPAGATQDEIEAAARADEKIASLLAGHDVVKVIVVPGRLINFVTK
jgi:leucyl-tRNA synthetase